jgi:CheY-like chemotaxis protein
MLLEQLGHEVAIASDGQDGVTKAAAFCPHVVFLDLGMPRMDGTEAATRLRTLPSGWHTILIALTGWGQEHDLQRPRDAVATCVAVYDRRAWSAIGSRDRTTI